MQRYSKAYLAKYPEKQGQDLATTRKACERYKTNPVSVFNFLEGTRFTPEKHDEQNSPFEYLLKPKAGGIAFVLDAMGEQLQGLVNVTLHYPGGRPNFGTYSADKSSTLSCASKSLQFLSSLLDKATIRI